MITFNKLSKVKLKAGEGLEVGIVGSLMDQEEERRGF